MVWTPEKKIDNDNSSKGRLRAEEYNADNYDDYAAKKKYHTNAPVSHDSAYDIMTKATRYDDTGVDNNVILNKIINNATPTTMEHGITLTFVANSTNTGNVVIKIGVDGELIPAKFKGGAVPVGYLSKGELYSILYNEVETTNEQGQNVVEKWFDLICISTVFATEEEIEIGVDKNKSVSPHGLGHKINTLIATEEDVLAGNPGKLATANQISSGGIDSGIGYTRDVQNCAMTCLDTVADALMLPQKLGFDNLLGRKIVLKYERGKLINKYMTDRDYWLAKSPAYINATNNIIKAINYVYSYIHDIGGGFKAYFTPHFGAFKDKEPWSSKDGYGLEKDVNTGFLFQDSIRLNRFPMRSNYSIQGTWNEEDLVYVGEITDVSIKKFKYDRANRHDVNVPKNGYTIKFKLPSVSGYLRGTSDSSLFAKVTATNIELSIDVNLGTTYAYNNGVRDYYKHSILDYKKIFNAYYSNEYDVLNDNHMSSSLGAVLGSPHLKLPIQHFDSNHISANTLGWGLGYIKVGLRCDLMRGATSTLGTPNPSMYEPSFNKLISDVSYKDFYYTSKKNYKSVEIVDDLKTSNIEEHWVVSGIKNHTDSTLYYTTYSSEVLSPVGYVLPRLDELKTRPWYNEELAFDNVGKVINEPFYQNMTIQD